jgi:membrane associated rhomboid family serine protease
MFFFFLPVGVDYDARRYPVVTFTLVGINLLVYLLSLVILINGGIEALRHFVEAWGLIPAQVRFHAFLTSMFTHAGLVHFLGNMVYLYLFGACVEDMIGRGPFLAFYMVSGWVSEAAHVMLASGDGAYLPCVGASGAISACLGAFLLLQPKTRINFRYWGLFIVRFMAGEFWIPAWIVLSFWFLGDLYSLFASSGDASQGGIAFAAHVGGFLAGMAIMAMGRAWHRRPAAPAPAGVRTALPPTIYLWHEGVKTGPFTVAQVRDMVALGSITTEAWYWREGMADWKNVLDLV